MNHLIIGSSFTSLGTVLGLLSQKKKKIYVINSNNRNLKTSNDNKIKLMSRNFKEFTHEINSSYKINKILYKKENNFISYLGPGGLSNIWGKLLNSEISEQNKYTKFLIKKLEIKKPLLLYNNKNFLLFKHYESNLIPLKILKNFHKKKLITILNKNFIENIDYDKIEKKFTIYPHCQKKIHTKKLYLASGFFSNIKFIGKLIGEKNLKQPIKVNHKDMLYGFFINKKKNFSKKTKINEFFFLDKKHNYFSGKILNLKTEYIKKYNLNPIFYLIIFFFNSLGYNFFVFNFFYKKKKTRIFLKENNLEIKSPKTVLKKKYLSIFKKKYHLFFQIKFLFAVKTLTGSDFHYSTYIKYYIKNCKRFSFLKDLYISDGTCVKKNIFFPTFFFIYNSFFCIKKNLNLLKI
jgi:hypothetical protein